MDKFDRLEVSNFSSQSIVIHIYSPFGQDTIDLDVAQVNLNKIRDRTKEWRRQLEPENRMKQRFIRAEIDEEGAIKEMMLLDETATRDDFRAPLFEKWPSTDYRFVYLEWNPEGGNIHEKEIKWVIRNSVGSFEEVNINPHGYPANLTTSRSAFNNGVTKIEKGGGPSGPGPVAFMMDPTVNASVIPDLLSRAFLRRVQARFQRPHLLRASS